MINAFNIFIYEPFYNGLIFLSTIFPGSDLGIAVILLTLIVKFILLPITHKSIKTQVKMRILEPEVNALKEKYKEDKEGLARQIMELYRKNNINPFSSCLGVIIQIPIILGLYWVFWKGLSFDPEIVASFEYIPGYINTSLLNHDILYSFVKTPEFIKSELFGVVDMLGKSVLFALIAGISQYYQIKLTMFDSGEKFSLQSSGSFKDDLAKSMKFQMRYILPIFVFIFSYTISASIALYWAISNIFTITHELLVKRNVDKSKDVNDARIKAV